MFIWVVLDLGPAEYLNLPSTGWIKTYSEYSAAYIEMLKGEVGIGILSQYVSNVFMSGLFLWYCKAF